MVRVPLAAAVALGALAAGAAPSQADGVSPPQLDPVVTYPPIVWHHSRALGQPWHGRLVKGVQLPNEGPDFFTWDVPLALSPNRGWRRWGTDRLVRTVLNVLRAYRADNPDVPRVGIADIARKYGGKFGKRYGGLGHKSHQNGLDIDIFYPRLDWTEQPPTSASEIDRKLAQDVVNRFVDAGVQYVFVGPRTGLRGPRGVVQKLAFHDDHMHVRVY